MGLTNMRQAAVCPPTMGAKACSSNVKLNRPSQQNIW